jgi:DNA-binding transcriptional MocR family regulator
MFSLDRSSPVPLADQVESQLRALIEAGRWPAGTRLPSIRQLAEQLSVSANTIVTAYDRLVAAALIDSRATAGFFVNPPAAPLLEDTVLEAGEQQEPVWLAQQASDQRPGVLLASSGALPPQWLDDAVPASLVARALSRSAHGMATRCPPQGLPDLRDRIATLLRGQGIAVDPGRVLTSAGGTHAIDLICRAFLQPGDTVLVEDPGYFLLVGRLKDLGAKVLPITRRHDGIDLDELETACRTHRPRLMFVQSVLHNPTGWGSTPANLHKVLVIAHQHGMLLAEDDVHGHFHPGNPTRLAQLGGLERVIYYSSFCKALSPALRIGYIAAEPAILKPLLRQKIYSMLTTPALNEMVLLELLAAGRWRKHLDRLQRKLAAARNASTRQLRAAGILLEHPAEGGLFLWGALPHGTDVDGLVKDAWHNRILLARGATFSPRDEVDLHIRFNVVQSQNPRLAGYLAERLSALASARHALHRAASTST